MSAVWILEHTGASAGYVVLSAYRALRTRPHPRQVARAS